MEIRQSLGRQFGWLWTAYTISTLGTWLGFGAFPMLAILVLHASAAKVSVLEAAGLTVGAIISVPLGHWVEFRRKRKVMIGMDLIRFLAFMSVPLTYALAWLSYAQLLIVAILVAASNVAFVAASGANLKTLIRPDGLIIANSRFESTLWMAALFGPPLGGFAIGLFGPVITIVVNALSFLCSALGIVAIGGKEPQPEQVDKTHLRLGNLLDGWRYIFAQPQLRLLLLNTSLNNGLIMASVPLVAVLMLGQLGFAPWQYGLAFGAPCLGGLLGSLLAPRLVVHFGAQKIIRTAGILRACWPLGLAFIGSGTSGLIFMMCIQFGLVLCNGVFNPVFATFRLELIEASHVARTLAAWSITSNLTVGLLTALAGLLATFTSPRIAIAVAGVLLLATPLLLPRLDDDKGEVRVKPLDIAGA